MTGKTTKALIDIAAGLAAISTSVVIQRTAKKQGRVDADGITTLAVLTASSVAGCTAANVVRIGGYRLFIPKDQA